MSTAPDIDAWKDCPDPTLRRKVQNRLNQRASRLRRAAGVEKVRSRRDRSSRSNGQQDDNRPADDFNRGVQKLSMKGAERRAHESILIAKDFRSWLASSQSAAQRQQTNGSDLHFPISGDHLLTLIHFNLIRALTTNVLRLGINPRDMAYDISSPFFPTMPLPPTTDLLTFVTPSGNLDQVTIQSLPPSLRPTRLQSTIPHHPEIDLWPFPEIRDNLLLAGSTIDDYDLCHDMTGRECEAILEQTYLGHDLGGNELMDPNIHPDIVIRKSPGLIAWGDPADPYSWEITDQFAMKWKRIFRGCKEIVASTNYWRQRRGEGPLLVELLD